MSVLRMPGWKCLHLLSCVPRLRSSLSLQALVTMRVANNHTWHDCLHCSGTLLSPKCNFICPTQSWKSHQKGSLKTSTLVAQSQQVSAAPQKSFNAQAESSEQAKLLEKPQLRRPDVSKPPQTSAGFRGNSRKDNGSKYQGSDSRSREGARDKPYVAQRNNGSKNPRRSSTGSQNEGSLRTGSEASESSKQLAQSELQVPQTSGQSQDGNVANAAEKKLDSVHRPPPRRPQSSRPVSGNFQRFTQSRDSFQQRDERPRNQRKNNSTLPRAPSGKAQQTSGGSNTQDGEAGPLSRRDTVHETQSRVVDGSGPTPTESIDEDGFTTDAEEELPTLSAKPTMHKPVPKKKQQAQPWRDDVRAFRRMPSERRVKQFEQQSVGEQERFSAAWKQRAQSNTAAVTTAPAQPAAESGRRERKGRQQRDKSVRERAEKLDIKKQRASRYERRQQRQEQAKALAPQQEEIFEVGAEGMAVGELADRLAVNSGDVLKALFLRGIMAQVNQILDKDMVKVVAEEYGVEVLDIEEAGVDSLARKTGTFDRESDSEGLVPRPPVVTVMGHVDHGKTSLLDYIRKAKVAAGEAGGITQAIGAYTCDVAVEGAQRKKITFLDTPGHEAFSAMRARGAKITDIAVIVVACDDGVRPQTREAIGHAKAAKVPIVVALNKIDKEGANVERAKQEMSEAGLLPEEWGGDTPMVPISAKKGVGIDELLETVLLTAEVEALEANPHRKACGTVVEAHLDRRMGPVATLLVATGTLSVGDVLHAGASYGKVRSLTDSAGLSVEEAGPSIAVQMNGLNSVPVAGDEFAALQSEQEARKVATAVEDSQRLSRLAEQAGGSMVTSMTFATMDEGDGEGLQHLNLVFKADASGAVEAVKAALFALPQDRVALRFLMAATGEITNSDVQLAYASEGHVVSFNLTPSESVMAQAKQFGVAIKSYKVIYELISDIRALMEGRLGAIEERLPLGTAEVRAVFGTGSKRVAGCMVTEGCLRRDCLLVVHRGKRRLGEGPLVSLRRMKDSVPEVGQGTECGVGVGGFQEFREGDRLEAFEVVSKTQTLEEASERQVSNSLMSSLDGDDYA